MRPRHALGCIAIAVAGLLARGAAAGDLDPPLYEMHEMTDPTGSVAIQVPTRWVMLGPVKDVYGSLGHWAGTFSRLPGQNLDASVYVRVMPAYSRAALARWGAGWNRRGTVVDGSVRASPGAAEEVRSDPEWRRSMLLRFVEREGRVFELAGTSDPKVFARLEGHLRAVFDTFRVVKRPELFHIPDGYAATTDDARVLWTDVRDKKLVKRVLEVHASGWKDMGALLPGAPVDAAKPLVVVCDKDAGFAGLTDAGMGGTGASFCAVLDHAKRAVIVRGPAKGEELFERQIHGYAARQRCHLWFGGPTEWIEHGTYCLVEYGMQGGATQEQANAYIGEEQRSSVLARKTRLDQLMELHWESLQGGAAWDAADFDAFTWQYFLRFGGGAKAYGARFKAYLDALRKDGDPTAAAKAFDGVDFDAMRTAFLKWVENWKR